MVSLLFDLHVVDVLCFTIKASVELLLLYAVMMMYFFLMRLGVSGIKISSLLVVDCHSLALELVSGTSDAGSDGSRKENLDW